MKTFLTIDPGDNTGWSFWIDRQTQKKPIQTGMYSIPKKIKKVEDQFVYMWNEFDNLINHFKPDKVYIEGVEVYPGSLKSKTASIKRSGQKIPSLFKLAFLIGGYCDVCAYNGIEFEIINFSQWGGQLSANAVKVQVEHLLKQKYETQHIYDAVAMGLYIKKLL